LSIGTPFFSITDFAVYKYGLSKSQSIGFLTINLSSIEVFEFKSILLSVEEISWPSLFRRIVFKVYAPLLFVLFSSVVLITISACSLVMFGVVI